MLTRKFYKITNLHFLSKLRSERPLKSDFPEIEHSFAQVFGTDQGRRVLQYLQAVTFDRSMGPNAKEAELRHIEGQRAMISTILNLVDRGRRESF